jgi:hypothetical protein
METARSKETRRSSSDLRFDGRMRVFRMLIGWVEPTLLAARSARTLGARRHGSKRRLSVPMPHDLPERGGIPISSDRVQIRCFREFEPMDEYQKVRKAREQVEAMTGFYVHLAVFAFVTAILFAINANSGDEWWAQWVLVGWGAGVVLHWTLVFGVRTSVVRNWQLRQIWRVKAKM